MPLIGNFQRISVDDNLEHGDHIVRHELRRHGAADEVGELLRTTGDVLARLYEGQLIFSTFGLHRNYEVSPASVDTYVHLVDLYLPQIFYSGSQMILQRVRSDAEKDVDQP